MTEQNMPQEKRIVDDILQYIHVFHRNVDGYFGSMALKSSSIEEFREYFNKAKPKINFINILLMNLTKRFSESEDDKKVKIARRVRTIHQRWLSNVGIVNNLYKLDLEEALSTYKRNEKILDENEKIISEEGTHVQKEIMTLLKE